MEQILELIKNFKTDKSVGKKKPIMGIIIGVIALIAVAILSWKLWKLGKERAKLLHEKAVNEEKEHQAKIDATILESEKEKEESLEKVETLKEKVEILNQGLLSLEEERERNKALINTINSWDDVDEIIN